MMDEKSRGVIRSPIIREIIAVLKGLSSKDQLVVKGVITGIAAVRNIAAETEKSA